MLEAQLRGAQRANELARAYGDELAGRVVALEGQLVEAKVRNRDSCNVDACASLLLGAVWKLYRSIGALQGGPNTSISTTLRRHGVQKGSVCCAAYVQADAKQQVIHLAVYQPAHNIAAPGAAGAGCRLRWTPRTATLRGCDPC